MFSLSLEIVGKLQIPYMCSIIVLGFWDLISLQNFTELLYRGAVSDGRPSMHRYIGTAILDCYEAHKQKKSQL